MQLPHPHVATAVPQEQALGVPGKQEGAELPFGAGSTGQHGVEAANQELMGVMYLSDEKLHVSLPVF